MSVKAKTEAGGEGSVNSGGLSWFARPVSIERSYGDYAQPALVGEGQATTQWGLRVPNIGQRIF